MLNDSLKLKGRVGIVLKDKDGNVKETRDIKNLVVNDGLAYIASRMALDSGDTGGSAKMSHMALGSNAGATAESDATLTALDTQLGSRNTLTSTTISGTNDEKVVYVASFGAGDATGSVKEAGIFNASSGGDMLCRTVFDVVTKAADDTMSVTWTITISAS